LIGAGTFINPLLKVLTTVAILAAVGIFIVRPALDTTERISADVNASIRGTQEGIDRTLTASQLQAQRSTIASYISSVSSSWPEAARELRGCARQAGEDGIRLQRCEEQARLIAHGTLSDYNFSTSYATALESQGETGAADRVRDCVKGAGFKPVAMERCRALADELLFG
jgi:hypothetical protein